MLDLWSLWLGPGQNQGRKLLLSLLTLYKNEAWEPQEMESSPFELGNYTVCISSSSWGK